MLQCDNSCCCNFQGFVVAFFAPLYLQEHVSILWSFRRLTKAHMSEPTQGSSIVTQCSNLCITTNNKLDLVDFVDFVDFVVQRHTPRGNFPRFLWTWGTCALGDPVAPVFVTLGHFSPPPCAKPDALRTRPAATPFFASGRVRCGAKASHRTP